MPLVEVLGTSRSHATPGWAYVPETSLQNPNSTLTTTTSRKRGIREPNRTGTSDLTSRQTHAILRRLAELDRENHRDNVHIPVPQRKDAVQRDNGRGARAKTTSNVRRILQSQKTFKNYLDDEEAALASAGAAGSTATVVIHPGGGGGVAKVARSAARRSLTPAAAAATTQDGLGLSERQKRALARKTPSDPATDNKAIKKQKTNQDTNDEEEAAAKEEAESIQKDQLIKTAYDNDHLLKSYIPKPPSDRLMAALLAEPPLRYHAARAAPSVTNKPARRFCTICGYWGKIKCKNCGVRTCGLECYKVHEDSRCGAFF